MCKSWPILSYVRNTSCREDSGISVRVAVISCFNKDILAERVLRLVLSEVRPREWSRRPDDIEDGSSKSWSSSRERSSSRVKLNKRDVSDWSSFMTHFQVDQAGLYGSMGIDSNIQRR